MTRAQEIKKILKGHFKNLRCTTGKGIAYGWVRVSFDYPKPPDCNCEQIGKYCYKCTKAKEEAQEEVDRLVQKAKTELYTYYSDDGCNTEHDCLIINVNLV